MRVCTTFCLHEDAFFLRESLNALKSLYSVALVSEHPWSGLAGDWQASVQVAKACGAEVIVGSWTSELEHRRSPPQAGSPNKRINKWAHFC